LVLLFTLFYANTSIVSLFLNEMQTKYTLLFLEIFLEKGQLQGIDIWINSHYKIIITQSCNGMIPTLFLYASILAYPSSVRHKLLWMLIGYILFFIVNAIRLLFVVYVTQTGGGQAAFYWSHDLVGNAMLMFTGLGLFIAFIKTARSTAKNL
jgi:exosortase/archaeosortase family protein